MVRKARSRFRISRRQIDRSPAGGFYLLDEILATRKTEILTLSISRRHTCAECNKEQRNEHCQTSRPTAINPCPRIQLEPPLLVDTFEIRSRNDRELET